MRKFANYIAFQIGWFACVLGAARGDVWIGPAVVTLVALLYVYMASRRADAALFLFAAAILGGFTDTLLASLGTIAPVMGDISHPISPPWLVAMWVNFGTILDVSMGWLRGRRLLTILSGAVGGPIAYYSGERLGAVTLGDPLSLSLAAIGVAWAVVLPVLYRLLDINWDALFKGASGDTRP